MFAKDVEALMPWWVYVEKEHVVVYVFLVALFCSSKGNASNRLFGCWQRMGKASGWVEQEDSRRGLYLWGKFRSPDGADGKPGLLRTGKTALPYRLQPWHAQAVRHSGRYGSANSKVVMADFRTHPSRSPCLFHGAIEEGYRGERDRALLRLIIVCSYLVFPLILW